MAQPRRKATTIDNIKCRRDKDGRQIACFIVLSCAAVCACVRRSLSEQNESLGHLCTHLCHTNTWASQT